MPDLSVRIKKKTDGSAALSCTRADGSVTWQRQDGQLGAIFPLHDLTHYAVETTLGLREAFFGLLASGWDISDFARAEMKPKFTTEALIAEAIVGYFDLERMTGERPDAAELNRRLAEYCAERGLGAPLELTEPMVATIRATRAALFERWRALPAGESMELPFDRTPMPTSESNISGERP